MKVIKRSGEEVEFNLSKVIRAITAAADSSDDYDTMTNEEIEELAKIVMNKCENILHTVSVEEISDFIEVELMKSAHYQIARNFITYRDKRALARKANTTDSAILSLVNRRNEEAMQENSNKNPVINSTQRDYIAGEVSKDLTKRVLLPDAIVKAHNESIIHFHDMDYFLQPMHNCDLINLEDMLQNGTVVNGKNIDPPKSFAVACNVATQIVAQVASNQYGGQTFSLAHLAPFVEVSRQKYRRKVQDENLAIGIEMTEEQINTVAEMRLRDEIRSGIQTIQYQINTLMTTNGQAPFVSVMMYINEAPEGQTRKDLVWLIEETLRQRIKGIQNEQGVWITAEFPKLLYVIQENNRKGGKYYETTRLAEECTAKRMTPDFISEKIMKESTGGDVYPCMGCRSFLTVDRVKGNPANAGNYKEGTHKYYGRFNQGVVTINLVDVACSSKKDEQRFWEIFEDRLENLCHKALRCRHESLLGIPSDVAPILWQHGALARLKKGETIDKLLYGGYSTLSLGYAGLYECVYYMTGKSHTDKDAIKFAKRVMQKMNDKCAEWKAAENIDYSVYGTPMESATYRFAKNLQSRFGIIKGVTDRNYITNSYHIHVTEEINAFDKLTFESEFQVLSPGGAISYVEIPNMQHNLDAVDAIVEHIYNTIKYAEFNTKSDYCQVCGYNGEIQIVEDEHHKLIWECPCCKNHDQSKMNVARRTCGYIGVNFWNQGKTQEIKERVMHLSIGIIKQPTGKFDFADAG